MKKNKAYDAQHYSFSAGEPVLIDANVWLYLQPPTGQPSPPYTIGYSNAFKNLLGAKARVLTEALVLSEYLNRYLRIEYAPWRPKYADFKQFRKSGDYRTIGQAAVASVMQILKISTTENTPVSECDISAILSETEAGTLDFNDAVLVESCRVYGWKLLTNDRDMAVGGIEVLTINNKLLAACP